MYCKNLSRLRYNTISTFRGLTPIPIFNQKYWRAALALAVSSLHDGNCSNGNGLPAHVEGQHSSTATVGKAGQAAIQNVDSFGPSFLIHGRRKSLFCFKKQVWFES